MRISDWSSDVCSSDLFGIAAGDRQPGSGRRGSPERDGPPADKPSIRERRPVITARRGSMEHIDHRVRLAELEAEEARLIFTRFDFVGAWRIGQSLVAAAIATCAHSNAPPDTIP